MITDDVQIRPDEAAPDAGEVLAKRYRLLEPLGRGGMGRVFRARDELLGRDVAVKLIFDDAVNASELRRACAAEARVAARLTHPGIARVLDSGLDGGRCFVVSELVDGRTLAAILREDGALPVGRALDLSIQLADALAAVHALEIVHCDVKPGNIIVDTDGTARLVDFGIARSAVLTTSLTGEMIRGSAEYVAPEQVEGEPIDGRADIYALGVVLYEMIAGRTPFGGGSVASVVARRLVIDPPSLAEQVPVPAALSMVVRKALARHPEQRFQSAGDLRDALIAIRSDDAGASTRLVPLLTLPRPAVTSMPLVLAIAFAFGLLLSMAVAIAPWTTQTADPPVAEAADDAATPTAVTVATTVPTVQPTLISPPNLAAAPAATATSEPPTPTPEPPLPTAEPPDAPAPEAPAAAQVAAPVLVPPVQAAPAAAPPAEEPPASEPPPAAAPPSVEKQRDPPKEQKAPDPPKEAKPPDPPKAQPKPAPAPPPQHGPAPKPSGNGGGNGHGGGNGGGHGGGRGR